MGRLTVLNYEKTIKRGHSYVAIWKCLCDCGNFSYAQTYDLRSGKHKSCGCLQKERASQSNKTHGLSKSPEYSIWTRIKARCYNTKINDYEYYGGRGIRVCDRWLNSFENFFEDMGEKPTPKHTIERIDNDGNYCPENCKWATRKEQTRNRKNTKMITHDNQTKSLAEWAEIKRLPYDIIKHRLRRGWSIQKALETPKLTTWSRR